MFLQLFLACDAPVHPLSLNFLKSSLCLVNDIQTSSPISEHTHSMTLMVYQWSFLQRSKNIFKEEKEKKTESSHTCLTLC